MENEENVLETLAAKLNAIHLSEAEEQLLLTLITDEGDEVAGFAQEPHVEIRGLGVSNSITRPMFKADNPAAPSSFCYQKIVHT